MASPLVRQTQPAKPDWCSYPTLYDSDQTIREYATRHLNPYSHRRRYFAQRAGLNLWMYHGRQWIESRPELAPGNGVYHFQEVHVESAAPYPRPVDNRIAPAVDNEMSRLGRKEYVADATVAQRKPEWMAAAELAKDIVKWEMSKQLWGDRRDESILNLCIDSIAILKTWWDENDTDLSLIANPDARICPSCKTLFASAVVPRSFATLGLPSPDGPVPMAHTDTLRDFEEQGEASALHPQGIPRVQMNFCPMCQEPSELKSYGINEQEAQRTDPFGRQLGLFVPTGDTALDVTSIHEFYPRNGGLQYEPDQQVICGQVSAKDLEWIALRFPDLADTLKPEEPTTMLRLNPLYADPFLSGTLGGFSMGVGPESYYNHALVKEILVQPQSHIPGLERGAHFAIVGDKVSRRELMVEVEGEEGAGTHYIPRVKYHFARFRRIPKNFWARSFVDDMIPLQRRLNQLDSQMVDIRERGKPNMWTPEGTTLATRDDEYGAFVIIEYDSEDPNWHPRDALFPGVELTGSGYEPERNTILAAMQAVGAPQDIEMGQAPGSVKTTSGLMLLSEEASQKRAPRERSLTAMYESAFQHVLEMNWAFRREDTSYEVQTEAGLYERKSYVGTDLVGGTRVKMIARAGYDVTLYNKEAAQEAIELGLVQANSPDKVDRLLELMKLPKDLNEGQSIQVRRAEMAWSEFMREHRLPQPDYTAHDPVAWYAIFLKRWLDDECTMLQRAAGWDDILPLMAEWESKLDQMMQEEAMLKPIYGSQPPDQWGAIFRQGSELVAQANEQYQKAMESFQRTSAGAPPEAQAARMGPQPPEAPPMQQFPPPPAQGFLPEPLHMKIYACWLRIMPDVASRISAANTASVVGAEPPGADAAKLLEQLLRVRAVMEAYRMMVMGTGSEPPPAAPGAGAAPGPAAPPAPPAGGQAP